MNTQFLNNISSGDRVVVGCVAGLIMFVAGYTATRMAMAKTSPSVTSDGAVTPDLVIPHQGELWQDFGPGL